MIIRGPFMNYMDGWMDGTMDGWAVVMWLWTVIRVLQVILLVVAISSCLNNERFVKRSMPVKTNR